MTKDGRRHHSLSAFVDLARFHVPMVAPVPNATTMLHGDLKKLLCLNLSGAVLRTVCSSRLGLDHVGVSVLRAAAWHHETCIVSDPVRLLLQDLGLC